MNHGLTEKTVTLIHTVFARHPQVEKAVLYGSRAKGTHQPGSDIDLTLIGGELEQALVGRMEDELDDLLLPYQFDLSILANISHADLLDHIRRVGVPFYERTPTAKV